MTTLWLRSATVLKPLDPGVRLRIGRSDDCDVHIADRSVSRLHAEVVVGEDGLITLRDGGSVNGVELNGKRMAAKATRLIAGDTFRVGTVKLKVERLLGLLRCPPLEPIALAPGDSITVGRNQDCDLVLRDNSVSRLQGVVHAEGNVAWWEPKGSTETYVNGRLATTRVPLDVGDIVTIAAYEVSLCEPSAGAFGNLDATRQAVVEMGLLAEVSLADRLQTLERRGKTGTVRVRWGQVEGEIKIAEGQPQQATYGSLSGEEAVLEMLSLREGRYFFMEEAVKGAPSLPSVTALLIEAARREDEG